jgi:UDP-N-acetylmuramoylalanine-D-glutamate ligase
MDLAGKKVLIIGAARSGIAAAQFLTTRGAIVALNDQKPLDSLYFTWCRRMVEEIVCFETALYAEIKRK